MNAWESHVVAIVVCAACTKVLVCGAQLAFEGVDRIAENQQPSGMPFKVAQPKPAQQQPIHTQNFHH